MRTPRAPRGSNTQSVKRAEKRGWSGNAIRPYIAIETNTLKFPRVDTTAKLDNWLIYKGEIWCRYPGCVHRVQFILFTSHHSILIVTFRAVKIQKGQTQAVPTGQEQHMNVLVT